MTTNGSLPWASGSTPLMLAPMQGLTNRALRSLFIDRYAPDIVFTEFIRVRPGAGKPISQNDRRETSASINNTPLVVQLIGSDHGSLVEAAATVQDLGAIHLNINLGCPFERMSANTAGGALLNNPEKIGRILEVLRPVIRGSFSVKIRSGFDDPFQILSLLALFEKHGVDFLIIHPRTVRQRYSGRADHEITAEVVKQTRLPVIANGDIFTAVDGRQVLDQTGAAGLMLGRGAINDPLLFEKIRGRHSPDSTTEERFLEIQKYLHELLTRYQDLFCGEQQILAKMKEVLSLVQGPDIERHVKKLKKCTSIKKFSSLIEELI